MDEQSEANKLRAAFIADALQADEQILWEGVGYDTEEVHRYIRARIAGEYPKRPEAIPWRR
jgi:hypothetical protein